MSQNLIKEKVRFFSQAYKDAKRTYLKAFPSNERMPYLPLVANCWRQIADFYAYYHKGSFVGLAYLIWSEELVFLLFLAVDSQERSRGYGQQIMADVIKMAGQRPIILTIEPLDQEASNSEQRLKRLVFYQRNGFAQTPHLYFEGEESYQILSNEAKISLKTFKELVQKATFHLIPIRVE